MTNLSLFLWRVGIGPFRSVYRSRLNFSDEDLIWRFISSKFNLHLSFWPFFLTFHQSVARYTPSSRPKNASKIKANLEFHKSSDDFTICKFMIFFASIWALSQISGDVPPADVVFFHHPNHICSKGIGWVWRFFRTRRYSVSSNLSASVLFLSTDKKRRTQSNCMRLMIKL